MATIDFWYTIGSTYTYLSAMRLGEVQARTGIAFEWRPFSVRQIMLEMDNRPFIDKPEKTRYMWRDLERRAQTYGIDLVVPAPYPLPELDLANRVALVGREEGWCEAYTKATYTRWFNNGQPAGEQPNLRESLQQIGQDPQRVIECAKSEGIAEAWRASTAQARSLGIFGSPTFAVDGELFWGDDRLDDALAWIQRGSD